MTTAILPVFDRYEIEVEGSYWESDIEGFQSFELLGAFDHQTKLDLTEDECKVLELLIAESDKENEHILQSLSELRYFEGQE
jgi:hypothetical protein